MSKFDWTPEGLKMLRNIQQEIENYGGSKKYLNRVIEENLDTFHKCSSQKDRDISKETILQIVYKAA